MLLGDFNVRLGDLSGDPVSNSTASVFKEFLQLTFNCGSDGH
jgi:hypothetical protein